MLVAYKKFWQHSFHIKGVATRAEFWWAFLVNFFFEILFQAMQYLRAFDFNDHPSARVGTGNPHMTHWLFAGGDNSVFANTFAILAIIFMLATLIPKFTIAVRRSHDFNWSAHWLIAFWVTRFLLFLVTIYELILLVVNYDDGHVTASMANFEWGALALLIFFVLELIEWGLLAKKSKRPNRFLANSTPTTNPDDSGDSNTDSAELEGTTTSNETTAK
ncbi:MAG: DUF805 domain-containing protein [Furfurilactobacillus sp.]|jgi:uncharacterized membrane protein YhaH (DUF805 family)|uniref:DUF805 domain-containing protein n=1 Tax=Furfurilactobacillus milii TaxID=2888272 RepID=A0ABT6DE48_9LACO|nr:MULTISPECIES: DUF805 domain-containing protein [Furfurilactobacillus]QLE67355.1 hypothetical protein LROSL2_2005 [Furfurilactobacillus rossiae]MCF6161564.1 DUF805 domain-containing protein [Furfurilactobacillus milii]MCF6163944.1 DUF805 domain-containing protein [Furfurilactobacillus milii]MCH4011544.1 DUF805 domain-containing protein [Furfurilactobacillus sp.]MCH4037436.1 DUF805 domain-containing protein [Furfurilactobacillus sp.]